MKIKKASTTQTHLHNTKKHFMFIDNEETLPTGVRYELPP
jgi:hypothetical protein